MYTTWYRSVKSASSWNINHSYNIGLTTSESETVHYLHEFKEEKDKTICKMMSKTQLKTLGLNSNAKCVNGVPYADPTQFLSALCSFSRD